MELQVLYLTSWQQRCYCLCRWWCWMPSFELFAWSRCWCRRCRSRGRNTTVYTAPTDLHKAIAAFYESGIEESQVTELENDSSIRSWAVRRRFETSLVNLQCSEDDEDVQNLHKRRWILKHKNKPLKWQSFQGFLLYLKIEKGQKRGPFNACLSIWLPPHVRLAVKFRAWGFNLRIMNDNVHSHDALQRFDFILYSSKCLLLF